MTVMVIARKHRMVLYLLAMTNRRFVSKNYADILLLLLTYVNTY